MKENKLIMGVDPEVLAVWRDIIYVVCTLIQTLFGTWFFHYFLDKRKRKKDRKKEDKQREEDRQKADADNLAAVLRQTAFEEVERIFDRFKKKVVKLREKKITDRFSAYDVLAYMCHPDNQEKFATTNQSYEIKEVMSDADSIMKLFANLHLTISFFNHRTCPKNIKNEFSSKIEEMGQAISPFVSDARRKDIVFVLVYFGQKGNPGYSQINEDEIPYIEFLQYEDGNMDCNIPCTYSNLQNLEHDVRRRKSQIIDQKDEIQKNIRILLDDHQVPEQQTASSDQIYLLHLIRIVMLKIHKRELNDDNISEFIAYVRGVDCQFVAEGLTVRHSERAVRDIEALIDQLKNDHQIILGYEQTPEFLKNTAKEIRKFIKDRLPRTQT